MSEVPAEIDGNRINVHTAWRDRDLIRQIPGATWNAERQCWRTRVSWPAVWQLRNVFGDRLRPGPELRAWVTLHYENVIEPSLALRNGVDTQVSILEGLDERLKPEQEIGASFLISSRRCTLADLMGYGKTVQVCAALEWLRVERDIYGEAGLRVLVVCPNTIKRTVWEPHVRDWTSLEPFVTGKTAATRRKAIEAFSESDGGVLIMNYESVWRHSRVDGYGNIKLKRCEACQTDPNIAPVKDTACETCRRELNELDFDVVVLDEAHRIKNPQAKQTRGIWAAAGDAPFRWNLTGTPIADAPDDYWSLLRFQDPDGWPAKTRYIDRYCEQQWTPWGSDILGLNQMHKEEFYTVTNPHFLRRTVGSSLPKVYETRTVGLSRDQRRVYDELKKECLTKIEGGHLASLNHLDETTRLLQISAASLKIDEESGRYVMCEPSSKLDELEAVLEDLGDEQVIVYAESRQLINLAAVRLRKRGISCAVVTGDVPEDERVREVDSFQAGESRVFLATYGAAAEGVTLTASNKMVFLQRSWSLIKAQQVEHRNNRHGQEADHCVYIDIVAEDTIESRVLESNDDKATRLAEVCQDPATFKELV